MASTPPRKPQHTRGRPRSGKAWSLSEHFPYHLSFTSELVSMEQVRVVQEVAGLTLQEWRVMVVLGSFQPLSTKTVASFTTMNKVAASRAVTSLVEMGYIERQIDADDSRLLRLEFTPAGRDAYLELSKQARKWADFILEPFSESEIATMKRFLARLRARLRETAEGDWPVNDRQLFGEI